MTYLFKLFSYEPKKNIDIDSEHLPTLGISSTRYGQADNDRN